MVRKRVFQYMTVLAMAILACQMSNRLLFGTPTLPQQTATVPVPYTTRATTNARLTAEARSTADAQSTIETQLTLEVVGTASAQVNATDALKTKRAAAAWATSTQVMAAKQTAKASALVLETAQAQSMLDRLSKLQAQGIIPSPEGEFHSIEDFDESWAQMNWFKWWSTDFSPENFVIYSNTSWSSASDKANWFNSGCGFVFGATDNDNFHFANLSLDGNVNLKYWLNGEGYWIAQRRYGKLSTPDGSAEIMLIVYNKRVTFFINDIKVLSEYAGHYKAGVLALSLVSGTNKDYGTRCMMSNIGLWIFK